MTKKLMLTIGLGALCLGAILTIWKPLDRYKRSQCEKRLRLLGFAIQAYRMEHRHFPDRFSVVADEIVNPAFLICPGGDQQAGRFDDADSWSDYILVDWSKQFGTNKPPNSYPLVYDRRMRNHASRGINVLKVDGVTMWDPHANWLRGFASSNRTFQLVLPE